MAAIPARRSAVPRTLHWASLAFLLTIGVLCVMAPGQAARDPSLRPVTWGGWLLLGGVVLFPVLHSIGVYCRSAVASALAVPAHFVLAALLVVPAVVAAMRVVEGRFEQGDVAVLVVVLCFAALELLLAGLLAWWGLRLWRGKSGPSAAPAAPTVPELAPLGTTGWMIERPTLTREFRKTDERVSTRHRWFLPAWLFLRWTLYVLTWVGFVLSGLLFPGVLMATVSALTGGADGLIFITLAWLIAFVMLAVCCLLAWSFTLRLRERVVDIETLIMVPFLAIGIVIAVAAFLLRPEA